MGRFLFKQLSLIASAFMYLTRIPMPAMLTKDNPSPNTFAAYFPFVGWFVGGVGAVVF